VLVFSHHLLVILFVPVVCIVRSQLMYYTCGTIQRSLWCRKYLCGCWQPVAVLSTFIFFWGGVAFYGKNANSV